MRLIRGLGALLALIALVVGVPVVLVGLGGNPLPVGLSWSGFVDTLLRPDDGSVLVGLVTIVAWIAWGVFVASVSVELVAVLSRYRIRVRLPGLVAPQRLAAGLLLSVVSMISSTQLSTASPAPPMVAVSPAQADRLTSSPDLGTTTTRVPEPLPPVTHAPHPRQAASPAHVHVVADGDDLWSLAEHFYGRGQDWRKIAAANPDRLTGGPDRLVPGWRLRIPDVDPSPTGAETRRETDTVVVRSGDTLSSIADRLYGEPGRWQELYRANRFQLTDPDEVPAGVRLVLPSSTPSGSGRTDSAAEEPPRSTEPKASPAEADRAEPDEQRGQGETVDEPAVEEPSVTTGSSQRPDGAEPTGGSGTDDATPEEETSAAAVVAGLASVGGLLAASVVAGLTLRRRVQLQQRPIGRRVVQPPDDGARIETGLGRRQRPVSLRTLDLATRAIAAHCRHTGVALPSLALATVGAEVLELEWRHDSPNAPVGFDVSDRTWRLEPDDVDYLRSVPGIGEAARPYPALITIGVDREGRQLVADLEAIGLLTVQGKQQAVAAALAAMAVELSFSPWADEMILTLVGTCVRLPEALGMHNVTQTDDVASLLDRLERRAEVQRAHRPHETLGQHRVDPDLADPWAPEIVLVAARLEPDHRRRLERLLVTEPRVTMAAVVAGHGQPAEWDLVVRSGDDESGSRPQGRLLPRGIDLVPQLLEPPAGDALVDLVAVTGSTDTTPAPWWDHGNPDPPPDNVTYLGKRFGGWAASSTDPDGLGGRPSGNQYAEERADVVAAGAAGQVIHPILHLLGPVELVGAAGTVPPRAAKQCLEYCGWLLEHPGTTAHAMASALVVAEGTRRSNMSRLRTWLGSDPGGEPYLPDAYTGRIVLHPAVSSDWQRLQILTARGVNLTSSAGLRAALDLVGGAPLADAAPGQWHWAEELRTDMVSAVRDIAAELADRALADHDIDLARWAAARGLVAAPGDELLTVLRIRTEHQVGNTAEVERLTLQLAAQARGLGVDLQPDTVILLQEVMEGRVRARMA